jgi:DNA-directed RNA polymerase specialized sigma24 family protein
MERSDSELIEACLRRDAQAWQELVARYSRLVYSIPRRKGLTPEDADDVFQNVFTIIYLQLPKLREHQALPAWIITITQRQCYRLRSRVQQEVELDEAGLNLPADSDKPLHWNSLTIM